MIFCFRGTKKEGMNTADTHKAHKASSSIEITAQNCKDAAIETQNDDVLFEIEDEDPHENNFYGQKNTIEHPEKMNTYHVPIPKKRNDSFIQAINHRPKRRNDSFIQAINQRLVIYEPRTDTKALNMHINKIKYVDLGNSDLNQAYDFDFETWDSFDQKATRVNSPIYKEKNKEWDSEAEEVHSGLKTRKKKEVDEDKKTSETQSHDALEPAPKENKNEYSLEMDINRQPDNTADGLSLEEKPDESSMHSAEDNTNNINIQIGNPRIKAKMLMRHLSKEKKEKFRFEVEGFKKERQKFDNEVAKRNDCANDIVVLAKQICMIIMEMMDFTRSAGSMKHDIESKDLW